MSKVDLVKKRLRARSDGRNHEDWPVMSFGGRDADLDPGGCTGIADIKRVHNTIVVTVGGYKVICRGEDPDVDELHDRISNLVCGWGYESSGDADSFTLQFSQDIVIDNFKIPVSTLVVMIESLAEVACTRFEESMTQLENACDAITKEYS